MAFCTYGALRIPDDKESAISLFPSFFLKKKTHDDPQTLVIYFSSETAIPTVSFLLSFFLVLSRLM